MRIVNAHAHLGDTRVFDGNTREEDLIAAMDAHGIDAAIVMPSAGAASPPAVHDRIAELGRRYPARIFGQIQMTPHMDHGEFRHEAERCVRELGFVGIKLHPIGAAVNPLGKDAQVVYEVADGLDIPLMVHTGTGVPWSLPSLMIPIARRYPRMRIILAHAGMQIYTMEAWVAATECPNIFLEPSWCAAMDVRFLIDNLGAHRIMWGGDLISNYAVELAKFRSLGLSDQALAQCLGQSAIQVYRLPPPGDA
jgi:predicted TIM-barrel fold metal-dependent hydrolase